MAFSQVLVDGNPRAGKLADSTLSIFKGSEFSGDEKFALFGQNCRFQVPANCQWCEGQ